MTEGLLRPGTLRALVENSTRHALACGAMQPIATHSDFVEQRGMRFLVRVVSSLARKDSARRVREPGSAPINPFLPYESDLHVADISPSHVCLLNKFNVVDGHILIITRHFEDQLTLLTAADFAALATCMAEYPALGFYNGGAVAGASQRHKHLQMVPLPLADNGPAIPVAPLLDLGQLPPRGIGLGRDSQEGCQALGQPLTLPTLPFRHAFMKLDGLRRVAELAEDYLALLAHAEVACRDSVVLTPYDLLLTEAWMLVVPRSVESYAGISINALGYAGALLVRSQEQMALLRRVGPLEVLSQVAAPAT